MKNRVFPVTEERPPTGSSGATEQDKAAAALQNGLQQVEGFMRQHPLVVVSAGLCAGVLLGCLIKRR